MVATSIRRASSREPGRERQETAATAAANGAKTSGFMSPIWATTNSRTKEGAKPCGGARPSCFRKVAQPCSAFHATNGAKIAAAMTSAAAEAGETSQRLRDGALTKAVATPAAKKAAVNFDCSISPSATPIARSHGALPVRQSSTSAASPRVQKTTSGASGVTNTAPAITRGIAIHIRTASAAVSAERKSRQAMRATSAGSAPTRMSDNARTPSSEPPKSVVDARIRTATIGG